MSLLGINEVKDVIVQSKFGQSLKKYRLIPERVIPNVSHWMLSFLVFVSGLILLGSAATPGVIERITIAEKVLSETILNVSNQLSVTAGISLLLLSRSIYLKVKPAYKLTYIVLLSGAVFTFSKGLDFEEALFLLVIALLLRFSKKRFYRKSYPYSWTGFLTMSAVTIASLVSYVAIGYINQPKRLLPPQIESVLVKQPADLVMTAVIGFVLALLFNLTGFRFLMTKKQKPDANEEELVSFLEKNKGNVLTHFAFLRDKEFFWSSDQQVFFMFSTISNKLVVLGDPIGNEKAFPKAIRELHEYADVRGLTPVFYQVEAKHLPLYHENGCQFFKLGEEAYVDLDEFTLVGKKKTNLRTVLNKFAKSGHTFTVHDPPFSKEFMHQLKVVSDEWLGNRREKGFSLGFFDCNYLQKSQLATLSNEEGDIIAFMNLVPMYDEHETISVDLMRHKSETPNGTMDMMFLSAIQYAKEQGYRAFHLGMAPLSNVGRNKYAFLDEKVAANIYRHGHYLYQFDGIRRYKEKFATRWEPKYLACRRRQSLPMTVFQLSILIARKRT
ncbi:bifunctional lysylphosphatidylglycerol flippase/synthetase MprF [Bacillus sp. CGMCC 1.16541]|uniref:bifunctional lysylphosphatidylglycerol flippase/synthetase MprF n=1 Tax=Bacillus sp. CGMCC 1.16541 TaxID=2185143 RepID=UPI000D73D950|nr:bifunctional lysylphosphatidylglycerol flippase/synthetase MprF [Bacillus sp. CGMCC 1.16541]